MKILNTAFKMAALGACALASLNASADEAKIVIDGSTTVGPIAKAFADYYKERNPKVNITISESGSGNGVKSLMNKACNIANMSRFMKAGEFKSCVEKGVCPVATVVAFDGLALVVNPENKVNSISLEDAAKIYRGEIRNWKELGGDDAEIIVISRDTNSGTFETFNELVMKKTDLAKNVEYVNSNGQARTRVNTTKNAIGYVGLGFVDSSVKPLSVNGVLPSKKTIASGKYAIARPLYMFTDGYPKMGSPLFDFINIYLTEDGQDIISDIGYVPLTDY